MRARRWLHLPLPLSLSLPVCLAREAEQVDAAGKVDADGDVSPLNLPAVVTDQHWDFGNQTQWAALTGTMCNHVNDQSPIDMHRSTKQFTYPLELLGAFSVRVGPASWRYDWPLVNASLGWSDWGSWEVRLLPPFAATTRMTFIDREYSLQAFHFTSPSENRIEGEGFDMEVQHVLRSTDSRVLVISVMLRVGLVPDNPYLAQFWNDFPPPSREGQVVDKVLTNPFYGAFPQDKSFFVFQGSLTRPPCTNNVMWVVFQEPVLISRTQREVFRAQLNASSKRKLLRFAPKLLPPKGVIEPWDTSIGLNNRHLQQQGTRKVIKVNVEAQDTHSAAPTLPAHTWAYVVLGLLTGALLMGVAALAVVARHHVRKTGSSQVLVEEDEVLQDSSPESTNSSHR